VFRVAEVSAVVTVLDSVEFHPLLFQVIIQDHGKRIRAALAVHVDQGIKAALGAGEQPVDRALLVHLNVFFVEIFNEVAVYSLFQSLMKEVIYLMYSSRRGPKTFLNFNKFEILHLRYSSTSSGLSSIVPFR